MYRNVRALTDAEKCELKCSLVYGSDIVPEIPARYRETVENAWSADDIPDEIIFAVYDGISFVEDDFFCNMEACGDE